MPLLTVSAFFEYPVINGAENSFLAVAESLRESGIRFACIAPPHGPLAERLDQLGILAGGWNVLADGQRWSQRQIRSQLSVLLTGSSPDLIHANSLSVSRLVGPVSRELAIPSVGYLRDILRVSRRAQDDLVQNTRLVAVSRTVRDFHVENGLGAERIDVLYNGVDLEQFQPRGATGWLHQALGVESKQLLVGGIGQLGMRKGWDTLVSAARQVVAESDRVTFVVIGERTSGKEEAIAFEAAQRRAAASAPLQGRFFWLGRRPDISRILNELTMLVHPARQEPLGRVLLEAAASGTPTIATQVGGTAEIFPAGEALLIPPNDPIRLAEAILQLSDDDNWRQRLRESARSRAMSTFCHKRAATELLRIYHMAVNSR